MSHVTYKIVQHDGGWAYTVDGVFSEPFPTHAAALAAAKRAAAEQRVPGRTEAIEYETADGKWHTETAAGSDRPEPKSRTRRRPFSGSMELKPDCRLTCSWREPVSTWPENAPLFPVKLVERGRIYLSRPEKRRGQGTTGNAGFISSYCRNCRKPGRSGPCRNEKFFADGRRAR